MAKKRLGRPAGDPEKLKLVRFSLRLHPDLDDALAVLAEKYGLPRSVAAQHILVNACNADAGFQLLSMHGYRVEREKPAIPATGIAYLRGLQGHGLRPAPKKR